MGRPRPESTARGPCIYPRAYSFQTMMEPFLIWGLSQIIRASEKKGFRVRRRRIWRSLFRAGLLFNQYVKFFLVKGDQITEHRVISEPRFARAVGYRLDVFKELISIRSVETPRRGRQAECSVESSATRSCACGARSSLGDPRLSSGDIHVLPPFRRSQSQS